MTIHKRCVWIGVSLLVVAGMVTRADAQHAFSSLKYENAGRYIEIMVHGPIPSGATHTVFTPNVFWESRVDFIENQMAAGDFLQMIPTTQFQHLVPICPGETPKGNPLSFSFVFASPPKGVTQQVAQGHPLHPGPPNHKDHYIALGAVGVNNTPGEIDNYVFLSLGRHDPLGCSEYKCLMEPEEPTPPDQPVFYGSVGASLEFRDLPESPNLTVGLAVPNLNLAGVAECSLVRQSDQSVLMDLLHIGEWHDTAADGVGPAAVAAMIDVDILEPIAHEILAGETAIRLLSPDIMGGVLYGELIQEIFEQPGDFNGDEAVDAVDLAMLLGHWGQSVQPPDWITNWDGFVDATEMADVLANWGVGVGDDIPTGGTTAPEPATVVLVMMGIAAVCRRRRA